MFAMLIYDGLHLFPMIDKHRPRLDARLFWLKYFHAQAKTIEPHLQLLEIKFQDFDNCAKRQISDGLLASNLVKRSKNACLFVISFNFGGHCPLLEQAVEAARSDTKVRLRSSLISQETYFL